MARPLRARHAGAQSCEDLTGENVKTTPHATPGSQELRGYLRRNWLEHPAPGISKTRLARMSQASWAGPLQVRAYLSLELRGCFKRVGPDQLRSEHLQSQSCDDVSGENGRAASCAACLSLRPELQGCLTQNGPDHLARGISEPRVARISQAKWAIPHQARAYLSPALRGCSGEPGRTISRAASRSQELRRCLGQNWPDYLAHGISELRVVEMSQAKRARPPQVQVSLRPEWRDCLRQNWLDHLARGMSEPRVARMPQAIWAGPVQVTASLSPELRGCLRLPL